MIILADCNVNLRSRHDGHLFRLMVPAPKFVFGESSYILCSFLSGRDLKTKLKAKSELRCLGCFSYELESSKLSSFESHEWAFVCCSF